MSHAWRGLWSRRAAAWGIVLLAGCSQTEGEGACRAIPACGTLQTTAPEWVLTYRQDDASPPNYYAVYTVASTGAVQKVTWSHPMVDGGLDTTQWVVSEPVSVVLSADALQQLRCIVESSWFLDDLRKGLRCTTQETTLRHLSVTLNGEVLDADVSGCLAAECTPDEQAITGIASTLLTAYGRNT